MSDDPFVGIFSERGAPPPARQRRSDAAWVQLRDDYLAGASAPQLAERYGVSVSAIRTRARTEGWRRSDAPDLPPEEDDEALAEAAAIAPAELRELAWARAALAVRRGRLQEALGWTRMVRQLDALAERQAASPALQARAAASLARAADTLAALRRDPGSVPPRVCAEEREGRDLPRERGRSRAPQAGDGVGDADMSKAAATAPGVGVTPSTGSAGPPPPQAGEVEPVMHDLHELHAAVEHPRQYGPAVPPIPPEWVRRRLHAG